MCVLPLRHDTWTGPTNPGVQWLLSQAARQSPVRQGPRPLFGEVLQALLLSPCAPRLGMPAALMGGEEDGLECTWNCT